MKNMKCFLCQKNKNLLIKKYKYWTVLIHLNQCYLGRCVIKLNRHIVDLFDITQKERNELFRVMKRLRNALKKLFQPDLFNYASLGNEVQHLHFHLIPRYKTERFFGNIKFLDKNWGKNCWPHGEKELPTSILNKLRKTIKNAV